ncbi:hypothetical protein P3T76_007007 [Phytophthora citrophthora]|uniref:Uncharacterized protein n=1 Tax=Phytophthora citrophthora TaxID=4793 RepID=A0AAD9GPK0_9STRA|nr:hypothetical protein P3T76_007007 [Phytophthora citrophthora]
MMNPAKKCSWEDSPSWPSTSSTSKSKILNLCCPKCKATFLDFSGCTCVKCGNPTCDQYFCANCLQYSSSSSDATHGHVRSCSKNPGNDYFVSEQALNEVHRVMRTENLIAYFTNETQSEKIRFHVHTRIAKDLLDLRIELPKSRIV